jgi:hypothetical protein
LLLGYKPYVDGSQTIDYFVYKVSVVGLETIGYWVTINLLLGYKPFVKGLQTIGEGVKNHW